MYVVTVKSTMEISQHFVPFSKYMNFNEPKVIEDESLLSPLFSAGPDAALLWRQSFMRKLNIFAKSVFIYWKHHEKKFERTGSVFDNQYSMISVAKVHIFVHFKLGRIEVKSNNPKILNFNINKITW